MKRREFVGLSVASVLGMLSGCSPSAPAPNPGTSPATGGGSAPKKGGKLVLGLSIYTGWMPWYLASKLGIIKKWADKYGVEIEVVPFTDYPGSINGYVAGQCDALVVTNMDALIAPCSGGMKTTVVVVGDYSNGNDVVFTRDGLKAADLQDVQAMLVEGSVSQYLHARMLEKAGLDPSKAKFANVSDARIVAAFQSDESVKAVVTWNPWALQLAPMKGVTSVFSSADIPEEIQDLLVVRSEKLAENSDFGSALAGAWYEVLDLIDDGSKRASAVEYMAQESGCTPAEFEAQWATTALYGTPSLASDFTKSAGNSSANQRVLDFCRSSGLLKPETKLGISFPDGSVVGDQDNVMLVYDGSYMDAAAAGKL